MQSPRLFDGPEGLLPTQKRVESVIQAVETALRFKIGRKSANRITTQYVPASQKWEWEQTTLKRYTIHVFHTLRIKLKTLAGLADCVT